MCEVANLRPRFTACAGSNPATSSNLKGYTMKIVTHNGVFHADEVTAVAMLKLFMPRSVWTVKRTRDHNKIIDADIVVDVGSVYDVDSLRFDHHQGEYMSEYEPHKMSSAGMVLEYLTTIGMITVGLRNAIFDSFVIGVDRVDTGERNHRTYSELSYSSIISMYNPAEHDTTSTMVDYKFDQAVNFATTVLLGILRRHTLKGEYEYIMKVAIDKSPVDGGFLELPHFVPGYLQFMEDLGVFEEYERVIWYDKGQNDWRVRAMPEAVDSMLLRLPLGDGSGLESLVFVHQNKFIGSTRDKKDAYLLAEYGKR